MKFLIFQVEDKDRVKGNLFRRVDFYEKTMYDYVKDYQEDLRKEGIRICPADADLPDWVHNALLSADRTTFRRLIDWEKAIAEFEEAAFMNPLGYVGDNLDFALPFLTKALENADEKVDKCLENCHFWCEATIEDTAIYALLDSDDDDDIAEAELQTEIREAKNAFLIQILEYKTIRRLITQLENDTEYKESVPADFWECLVVQRNPANFALKSSGECESTPPPGIVAVDGEDKRGQEHGRAPGVDKTKSPAKKHKPRTIRPKLSEVAVFQRILELCPLPKNRVATAEWITARTIVEKKIADEQFKPDSDRQIRIKRGMKSLNSMRNGKDAQNKTIEYDGTWYIDSSGRIAFTLDGTNTTLYWHETIDGGKAFWREHFTADGKPREKKTGPTTKK